MKITLEKNNVSEISRLRMEIDSHGCWRPPCSGLHLRISWPLEGLVREIHLCAQIKDENPFHSQKGRGTAGVIRWWVDPLNWIEHWSHSTNGKMLKKNEMERNEMTVITKEIPLIHLQGHSTADCHKKIWQLSYLPSFSPPKNLGFLSLFSWKSIEAK